MIITFGPRIGLYNCGCICVLGKLNNICLYFVFSGIEPGSVVITDTAVDSFFKPRFEQVILDRVVVRSTELDKDLAEELLECSKEIKEFPTLIGHTMCTYDFYEGE